MTKLLTLSILLLAACSPKGNQPPIAGRWVSVNGVKCDQENVDRKALLKKLTQNTIEFDAQSVVMTTYRKDCVVTSRMEPEYFDEQNVVTWRNAQVLSDSCNKSPKAINKGEQRFKYELQGDVMRFTAQYGRAGCGYLVKI